MTFLSLCKTHYVPYQKLALHLCCHKPRLEAVQMLYHYPSPAQNHHDVKKLIKDLVFAVDEHLVGIGDVLLPNKLLDGYGKVKPDLHQV